MSVDIFRLSLGFSTVIWSTDMLRTLQPRTRVFQKRSNHFDAPHLAKCGANYAQLTPISPFLRTVKLFPSQPAYQYNEVRRTWSEVGKRVSSFAHALIKAGVGRGDVVSVMAPNIPALYEAHFAVPGTGGVLHSINTRLDATTVAYQLTHAESKVVFVDDELIPIVAAAKQLMVKTGTRLPLFFNINDPAFTPPASAPQLASVDYETFIASGDPNFELLPCQDEWDAITLNYTSGTTGNPKGVVCHHRGAYLNSVNNIFEFNMERFGKMLSVVPMFHCNGWCFTWTMANVAGCNFLVRQVRPDVVCNLIHENQISYMLGAPILMTAMLAYPGRKRFDHDVQMLTGGAPPPPALIQRLKDELGVTARTGYGLTESYGPASTHLPDPEWTSKEHLTADGILQRCTWQGQTMMVDSIRVLDPNTLQPVPQDGTTIGETMIRGNIMMKGYFKNPAATQEAFEGGWFHSGDLAVSHGNGRFEIKDRSKDIIISGGENISSIEVENIMLTHPGILEVAVVAQPDEKWGEVPVAFVARHPSAKEPHATEAELIAWAKERMPRFMAPKRIIFGEIAKTATGKVQKNVLRKLLVDLP